MGQGKTKLQLEEVETRVVPAHLGGFPGLLGLGGLFGGSPTATTSTSPAVSADLAKIQSDGQKLAADAATLGPTLRADARALATAPAAALRTDPAVQAARATLTTDVQAQFQVLRTDLASGGVEGSQFQTDLSNAIKLIQADAAAFQSALSSNAAVSAAQNKLTTDSAPLTADLEQLQADYKQLQQDQQAAQSATGTALGSGSGSGSGTGTGPATGVGMGTGTGTAAGTATGTGTPTM